MIASHWPKFLLAGCLVSAFGAAAFGMEIPLKQGGKAGNTIAYVDMEKVFQDFPETQKAKTEYFQEVQNKRQELADREKELADLREQLGVLRATLKEMQQGGATAAAAPASTATATGGTVGSSTATAAGQPESLAGQIGVSTGSIAAVNESLVQREKSLTEKETALDEARKAAAQSLRDLEQNRSLQIFGKLYNALVQIADEQGISIIVDKSSILYGQSTIDLTERLRRRVRGLPEEDAKP